MNPAKVEAVLQSNIFKYGIRVLVLYLFSLLFKSFDLTFPHEFGPVELRGQAFSLLYVIFGLAVWEGAARLSGKIRQHLSRKRNRLLIPVLSLFFVVYGLLAAGLFGFLYGSFDIVFFNRYEAWKSFSALSYELNFSTFLFYLLILGYNGIVYYYRNWQESRLKAEKITRQNLQEEYAAFRSRTDPYFFFNSLDVLTNLIYKSRDLAAEYSAELTRCYRYILDKKFENLISVESELEFLASYNFLLGVRHRNSIVFDIGVSPVVRRYNRIPPATLQVLVENAVRHNMFSVNDPLRVTIHDDGKHLYVANNVRKRKVLKDSPGAGLAGLEQRYRFTGGSGIEVREENGHFIVRLPVL